MHFFQLEIPRKKRYILSEKRESRMVLKKREFTPESGSVDSDTYASESGHDIYMRDPGPG